MFGSSAIPDLRSVPTNAYPFEVLASIYNQTRVDYIVPMPMNAKRMKEYVTHYDVDLAASAISINANGDVTGMCMIGFRQDRAWITRLGVIPERRQRKNGQFLAESCLQQACQRAVSTVQLEVIKGNQPAYALFVKLGFEVTRELLVIRRPPGIPSGQIAPPAGVVDHLPLENIPALLAQRPLDASWIEETASLLHAGNLEALQITLSDNDSGWLVFQRTPFQFTHFVFSPNISENAAVTLLTHLHTQHPMQDTKIENLPTDNAVLWAAYQRLGYLEVFRRIEMHLHLA